MEIYSYNDIKKLLDKGNLLIIDDKKLIIDNYTNNDLFFKVGYEENPLKNPSKIIKIKKIDNKKMEELCRKINEKKKIDYKEAELLYLPSVIYGLKYRNRIKIENGYIELLEEL